MSKLNVQELIKQYIADTYVCNENDVKEFDGKKVITHNGIDEGIYIYYDHDMNWKISTIEKYKHLQKEMV